MSPSILSVPCERDGTIAKPCIRRAPFPFTVGRKENQVTMQVTGVPCLICPRCGRRTYDLRLLADLEALLADYSARGCVQKTLQYSSLASDPSSASAS